MSTEVQTPPEATDQAPINSTPWIATPMSAGSSTGPGMSW